MVAKNRREEEAFSITGSMAFLLTAVVLFFAPYFRGLYFNQELYIAFIALGLALIALVYSVRSGFNQVEGLYHPLDYLGLFLIIAYVASDFTAVTMKEAVLETLKVFFWYAVYFLSSRLVRKTSDADKLLKVIYFSALGVALVGLAAAFGTLNMPSAFGSDKRITSTIQYANSLAVFLMPALIIGYYFVTAHVKEISHKIGYAWGNYLLLLAFMGTLSRGGWLIFAVIMPLFVLGMVNYRLKVLLHILTTTLTVVMVSGKALDFAAQSTAAARWGWVTLGGLFITVIVAGCSLAAESGVLGKKQVSRKTAWTIGVGIMLAAVVTLFILPRVMPELAPSSVINKVKSISLTERNVQERFVFYQDAMQIIKQHPLLGSGGGAWDALYRKYRSYYYTTAEVHNHYLKIWLEAGILGIASFLLIWLLMLCTVLRGVIKGDNQQGRTLIWVTGISALALGVHSLIDFNLSLGAISILLWGLFGLVVGVERASGMSSVLAWRIPIKENPALTWILVGVISIITLIPVSFLLARSYSNEGYQLLQNKSVDAGLALMEKAVSYNPTSYDSIGNISSARMYLYQRKQDPEVLAQSYEDINRAIQINSTSPDLLENRARILALQNKIPESIRDMETAVSLDPWEQSRYETLAGAYLKAGDLLLEKGDKENAKLMYNKLIGLDKIINQKVSTLTPQYKKLWMETAMLAVTPGIKEKIQTAEKQLNKL